MRRNLVHMARPRSESVAGLESFPPPKDLSVQLGKYIGRQVSYATHGIHKYPAKFIPQIPRMCIEKYSDAGETVLDPFMGSGTTLLEAYMSGRHSYGIDIHPLARLIAKVKTTPIDPTMLSDEAESLLAAIRTDRGHNDAWIPEMPNREHWFRPGVLSDLATVKKHVMSLPGGDIRDFFMVCLSSIVRKVSNSDDSSLIPEVTTFQKRLDRQGKTSYDVVGKFENTVRSKLIDAADLWSAVEEVERRYGSTPSVNIIGRDARDIELDDSSVDLAVTSPPYASAVHYVSVHKLEMFWLGLLDDLAELDSRLVGSARAYVSDYRSWRPNISLPVLDAVVSELMKRDRKSAYIVYRYFEDMRRNFVEVNRVLKRKGHYCVVVGENTFRRVRIPTYGILAEIGRRSGFELTETFVYDVINRHLDIPRWNDSRIEKDHILVFRKKGAPAHSCL